MNNLSSILKKEMREVFRDRKSLLMMLIIPVFIPLVVIGMSALFNSEVNKPIEEYNSIGFNYTLSAVEKNIAKELDIIVYENTTDELVEEYNKGNIDLYITKENNNYTINGEDNSTTSYAKSLMNTYFSTYKEYLQQSYLTSNNLDANSVINIINVSENIIEKDNYYATYITTYGFLFIIMAITVSATYPATDATAGEKERGTLETLLTFPIKSRDIILGKFLSVSIKDEYISFARFTKDG